MALLKQIVNNEGITTNYHRVSEVVLREGLLGGCLESYVSSDYRTAEQPADFTPFRFEITLEEEESMGIRALCYNKIKALDAWKDAEDC